MYSQNNEEEVIVEFFKGRNCKQRFLDIGAFDGKSLSNTHRLAEMGWEGACVEPSAPSFHKLFTLYKDNPRIVLVNAAIALASGLINFYESNGDAIGSFDQAHVDKWAKSGARFREILIKTITLDELFGAVGYAFSFLNLDVEALNLELFERLPLDKMPDLKLICIEHDGHCDRIKARLQGWRELTRNPENIIMARD